MRSNPADIAAPLTNNTVRHLSAIRMEKNSMGTAVLTERPFREAAEIWLETRKPYIGPRTYLSPALQGVPGVLRPGLRLRQACFLVREITRRRRDVGV